MSFGERLEEWFLKQKLHNKAGAAVVLLIALVFGYLVANQTLIGLGLFGGLFSIFILLTCLLSPEAGLYITISYCFFGFGVTRYLFQDAFPVGVGTDVLIGVSFLSLLIHTPDLRRRFQDFLRNRVVVTILLVLGFLLLEMFNPFAHSFGGWFQTFRRLFESILLLFITYCTFTNGTAIRRYVKTLFVMAVIAALYGCLQQWRGLFDFEVAWVMATENRFGLIFINGSYRKFSTMSDPTAFGIAMAACAIFFLIVGWHQKKLSTKLTLFTGSVLMLLAMAYSGTRTANAMMVIGLGMYVLLSFNRRSTKAFAVVGLLGFLFLMYAPIYSNPTINRFRSSFSGSEDESFKVREVNRKSIQPYIYSHPFGWGLGTTGAQGLQYNPSHFLAGFPPDSGYLKKALETGWIGLIISMLYYFVVIRYGVRGYFRSRNEGRKVLYAAAVATLFSFYVAEFAQEAIGQISDMVIYYPLIAMMLRMRSFDEKKEQALEAAGNPAATA